MDSDIVCSLGEIPRKFIRELHRLTTYVNTRYKCLYPSIIDENNMSANTMYGKILIESPIQAVENKFNNQYFDRVIWFVEDYVSGNRLDFCSRYFNMGTYEEVYDDIIEYFTTKVNPAVGLMFRDNISGNAIMCRKVNNTLKRNMVSIIDNSKNRDMITIQRRLPKYEYNGSRFSYNK